MGRKVHNQKEIKDDLKQGELSALEWHEMFVFRLSKRLGGRSEVLKTPLVEALEYLHMDEQERATNRLADFLNLLHADGMMDGEERQKYADSLMEAAGVEQPPMQMEWDKSALDKYRTQPQGG